MKTSLLIISLLSFSAYGAERNESTHCKDHEDIVFSCQIGKKILSVCASGKTRPSQSIEYRYGTKEKIEMTYAANNSNKNRFHALSETIDPKENVNELWFGIGGTEYVVTSCVGGNCRHTAGLIVFKKKNNLEKVIMSKGCEYSSSGYNSFSSDIVDFDNERSLSDLVIYGEGGFDLESLYPTKRVN